MIVWFAKYCPGEIVEEFDKDGKEIEFSKSSMPKEGMCQLGMIVRDGALEFLSYFELANGILWLRGIPLRLYIRPGKVAMEVTRQPAVYEPIEFKKGHVDMNNVQYGKPMPTETDSHHVGWKAKLNLAGKWYSVQAVLGVSLPRYENDLEVTFKEIPAIAVQPVGMGPGPDGFAAGGKK